MQLNITAHSNAPVEPLYVPGRHAEQTEAPGERAGEQKGAQALELALAKKKRGFFTDLCKMPLPYKHPKVRDIGP